MKNYLFAILTICLLLSIAGCSKKEKDVTQANNLVSEEITQEGELASEVATQEGDQISKEVTQAGNLVSEVKTVATEVDLQSVSEELALQMVKGDFDATYKKFTLYVKVQMTKESLEAAWSKTVDGMGKFIEVYKVNLTKDKDDQKVDVILRYENNGLKVSFMYNGDMNLKGLWLNYSPMEEEAVSTDQYEEIKITFGEGDFSLTGVLTIPKGVKKPPLVILVPGSGNHDVNETVGANKPFQDIAWGLAEQGIASIRYNERVFKYPELAQKNFTIEVDSLNDASDAIDYALTCDKIDKKSIFIIGHSLGAMMAPKIAADHPKVAGIVLLAGSPRGLEDIIYDQVQDAVQNAEGYTKKQIKDTMAATQESVDKIRNLKNSSLEVILGYPATYWYSLNEINIPDLASDLTIPMYIVQGSKDFQVYPDKDYKQWKALLGDKKNVTFHLYKNLNHLFMTSNGKTDITEYNTPGNVEQKVINDIGRWIKNN